MHDRHLEGETFVFGNQGALYKTAMTWFDHSTGSIWSQPIGAALAGELEGSVLIQIPSTWDTWTSFRARHPDAQVLANDLGGLRLFVETPRDNWVVGITVGGEPVVLWVDETDQTVRTYLRHVGDRVLSL